MRKIVLTYGLIAGAILSAMMLLTTPFHEQIGFDKGAVIGYTTMVLAFLMIFFGVRSYRDTVGGGTVSFGRALAVGMLITVVATLCYVATWELLFYTIVPDFGEKYMAYTLEKARAAGATEAQIAERTRELAVFWQQYRNPLVNMAFTFLEPLPVGIVFALVTAGVLSRKRRAGDGAVTGAQPAAG